MIGEGSSCKVFLAKKSSKDTIMDTNQKVVYNNVAVKILCKDQINSTQQQFENVIKEIKAHWALNNCDGVL